MRASILHLALALATAQAEAQFDERFANGDATPEALQAWKEAHGGAPVTYDAGYGTVAPEIHGHYFAPRHEEPKATRHTSMKDYYQHLHARSIPDFDIEGVDTSLTGYGKPYVAEHHGSNHGQADQAERSPMDGYYKHLASREIPEFDDLNVDTSLEGYGTPYQGTDEALSHAHTGSHTRIPEPSARDLAEEGYIGGKLYFTAATPPPATHGVKAAMTPAPHAEEINEAKKLDERGFKSWWEQLTANVATAGKEFGQEVQSVAKQIGKHL
ncbi:hypothetical protein LTR62_008205 [Meristemomyces frigidus]|uniref:Uncharacterized protein n=1 Tax=Meristemomyces frigidus TaxID=1508187 RepID=A0AAN7YM01_9PEZI|nr:hypothetical protein LTR62_008205 [Meristemomyces frigidus]